MKTARSKLRGFTMAEVLIALAATVIIIGALLLGCMSLQKSLRGSEVYASRQSDQRRLIDYIARDLRRAIDLSATNEEGQPMQITTEPFKIQERAALIANLPGYYQTNVPHQSGFDQPLPVVHSENGADYGTAAGPAAEVRVSFHRVFVAREGTVCFVRREADTEEVIVRDAADLHLRVSVAADRRSCGLEVWFRSPYSGVRPLVSSFDEVMLRNFRATSTP